MQVKVLLRVQALEHYKGVNEVNFGRWTTDIWDSDDVGDE